MSQAPDATPNWPTAHPEAAHDSSLHNFWNMVIATQRPRQDPSTTPESAMLDIVRRRIIEIHIGLEDATDDDREAKAWAQRELMALIRELTPYRKARSDATDVG